MRVLVAFFINRNDAEKAFIELEKQNLNPETLSVMQKKQGRVLITAGRAGHVFNAAASGILIGAVAGAVLGTFVWFSVFPITGFQNVLFSRALFTSWGIIPMWSYILSSAVTVGSSLGIFGAIIGASIPKESSHVVDDQIHEEGVLLVLAGASTKTISEARNVIEKHNPNQVRTIPFSDLHPDLQEEIHNGEKPPEKIHVVDIGN